MPAWNPILQEYNIGAIERLLIHLDRDRSFNHYVS